MVIRKGGWGDKRAEGPLFEDTTGKDGGGAAGKGSTARLVNARVMGAHYGLNNAIYPVNLICLPIRLVT